jgi:hypothetical protein
LKSHDLSQDRPNNAIEKNFQVEAAVSKKLIGTVFATIATCTPLIAQEVAMEAKMLIRLPGTTL